MHTYDGALFPVVPVWTFPTTKVSKTTWHRDEKKKAKRSCHLLCSIYTNNVCVCVLIASDATSLLLHDRIDPGVGSRMDGCCGELFFPDGKPKIGKYLHTGRDADFCYSQTNVRRKTDQHTVHDDRPFLRFFLSKCCITCKFVCILPIAAADGGLLLCGKIFGTRMACCERNKNRRSTPYPRTRSHFCLNMFCLYLHSRAKFE